MINRRKPPDTCTVSGKKIRAVHDILQDRYGEPSTPAPLSPLDSLVQTILSQHTSDINSGRAFHALKAAFPSWEAVTEAPAECVEQAIRSGGLAHVKTRTIQTILNHLKQPDGRCRLDLSDELPLPKQIDALTSLPGVGMKTACCVLLFSLNRPAFPVDTHVRRVANRLGWFSRRVSADTASRLLQPRVPPDIALSLHLLLVTHGRRICNARSPRCDTCPLLRQCPSAPEFQKSVKK